MQKHQARIIPFVLLILLLATSFPALSKAQDATEYRRRANVLRQAVQRCSQRLLSGDITACTVDVGFDVNRTVSMPEAQRLADDYERRAQQADREWQKKNCVAVRDRYIRDMAAVHRMQKTIQMSRQELGEWTKRNEEAQRAAIMTAVNFLLDGALGFMAEATDVLNGYRGAYAKYEKQLKRQKKRVDPLQLAKLNEFDKRVQGLNLQMAVARDLQSKKDKAEIFWGYFTSTARDVDESMGFIQAIAAAIEEDPIIMKYVVEDKTLMPLVNKLKTRKLFPKKPYLITSAEFLVDYAYNVGEWLASRNRIIQQYNVSDDQLRAVNSMQQELKKTMGLLNDCVNKGYVTRP